jgi:hypothetical protein
MSMEGDLATQETQQEPQDLRSVLESALDKQEAPEAQSAAPTETAAEARSRDEAGRFAAKPEEAKPAEQLPEKRPPSSWKKDAAAEFDKLPAHVQDEILRRETDFHKGIEGFKTHADLGKSMERAIQPYMQTIQSLGVSPDMAVSKLLQADHILRTSAPDQKAAYLSQLAQEYGIDLGQAQAMPQKDPYTLQLEQRLAQIQSQQQQFMQTQQQQQQETLNSEIQQFAKDAVHFEAVREDMAALLQAGRAKDLKDAYDMAVYANPQTRQALLEQQRQEALKQAQSAAIAARAKSAAVSVRGSSPASGSASAPTSLRAALEAAFNG